MNSKDLRFKDTVELKVWAVIVFFAKESRYPLFSCKGDLKLIQRDFCV